MSNLIEEIANQNEELLTRYTCILNKFFNIKKEELTTCSYAELKRHINTSLNKLRVHEYKLIEARLEIEEHGKLIEEYRRAYIGSDSYDQEFVKGGKINPPDKRHIDMLRLQEAQRKRIMEYQILEEEIKTRRIDFEKFIKLIPHFQYVNVMLLTYIHNMSNTKIAHRLNLDLNYVDQARFQGIDMLTKIFRKYLNRKK